MLSRIVRCHRMSVTDVRSVAPSAGETGAVFLSGKQAMAVVPFVSSNTSIIVLDNATAIVIFTSLDNSANPRVGVLFINGRN